MISKQKILIVDDRKENLVALRHVLQNVPAEIVVAESGNEALAATLDHEFALAILDVMMPGMSGFELAQYLRRDDKTRHLPVIFVTAAYPDEQHLFGGYDAGGVDYIVKPFVPEILLAKVRIFLELDRQKQQLQWQRDHLETLVAARTTELAAELATRKQAEDTLRIKNEELARFVYTASHDLKTPLVTIKAFLGALREDLDAANQDNIDKDLFYLHTAADKMQRLLDELLEMSRVGRVVNAPVAIKLKELVEEATSIVAGRIAERGVAVTIDVGELVLTGDRQRLAEIWQNLIDNAAKYMGEQAAPCIEIGVDHRESGPVFYVRDNGLGIEPQYHEKVFGLFDKLDPASEGTGLGLALVKQIVELNEGQIWVESAGAGQGSCFYFTLPAAVTSRR